MYRRMGAAVLVLALVASLGGGVAQANDAERLAKRRRDLMEAREALRGALGADRLAAVDLAYAEIDQFEDWLQLYRSLPLSSRLGDEEPRSVRQYEDGVRHAKHVYEGWQRDDASKGQGEGHQTTEAKEAWDASIDRLNRFKSDVVDWEVEIVPALANAGIKTYDELERRVTESRKLLSDLQKEGGPAGRQVRSIKSLRREVRDLERRVAGEAVFRRVHVIRRPRGAFEHMVPKVEKPNGGSWTRCSCTPSTFKWATHRVFNDQKETWDFQFEIKGMKETIPVSVNDKLEFEITASGSCSVDANVPEHKLSGVGMALDVRTEGAGVVRIDKGPLSLGIDNQGDSRTFKFRVNPNTDRGMVHFFLWNSPVHVTWIYRRD